MTESKPAVVATVEPVDWLGPTLELLNRVLPCNPPWGPGQHLNVERVGLLLAAERDCRTCKHWTPHHRSDVMHCSAALRCVAASSYQRQGVVQLWEAKAVDAGF